MNRKGFAPIIAIVIIAVLITAGAVWYFTRENSPQQYVTDIEGGKCPLIPGQITINFQKAEGLDDIVNFLKIQNLSPVSGVVITDQLFQEDVGANSNIASAKASFTQTINELELKNIVSSCRAIATGTDAILSIPVVQTHCQWNPKLSATEIDAALFQILPKDKIFYPTEAYFMNLAVSAPIGQEGSIAEKLERYPQVRSASQSWGNCSPF